MNSKMRKVLFAATLILLFTNVFAQTDLKGLQICIPVFQNRFDNACCFGGNDGSRLTYIKESIQNLISQSNEELNYGSGANACLLVGSKEQIDIKYKIKGLYVKNGFLTFRIMNYSTPISIETKIKGKDNTTTSTTSKKIDTNTMVCYRRAFHISNQEEFIITPKSTDKKNLLFYFDDVFVYDQSSDINNIKKAERYIIRGELTNENIPVLQQLVKENPNLLNIDLNSATSSSQFELQPSNTNCMMFDPNKLLTNKTNVARYSGDITSETTKFEIINHYVCDDFELTDGKPFDAMYNFYAKKVSYDRQFTSKQGYSTTCLPFTILVKNTGLKDAYSYYKYDNGIVKLKKVDTIKAGFPYIVSINDDDTPFNDISCSVSVTGTTPIYVWSETNKDMVKDQINECLKYKFYGSYVGETGVKSNDTCTYYGFQKGKFVKVGTSESEAVKFGPFRARFSFTHAADASAPASLPTNLIDAIKSPTVDRKPTDNNIYTISGEKINAKNGNYNLNKLPSGIYIVGGKKTFIKH